MRKRTAMQMDRLDEISSASTIAVPDVSDNTEPARTPLQSLSNPPAKRHRPSRQTGKEDKLSHGLSKAQKAAEVDAPSLVNKTEAAAPSLPPEIWRLIGEKIPHPQTLRSLVYVSRAFRDIFTPLLYARRIVNLEYFSKPLNETPLPPYLEYVHDFRVNLYEFRSAGSEYSPDRNDEFSSWITRALEPMKCLRSFSWRDESFEDTYDTALILRDRNLLRALKSIRTLREVAIHFATYVVQDLIGIRSSYVPLRGFRNLTSLEVYNLCTDYDGIIKDMGSALCDSPFLKKLGLGCAVAYDLHDDAIIYRSPGHDADFFERLCKFYGSASKTGPLALETLRLGQGIFLGDPTFSSGVRHSKESHPLTKLVNVKSLEVLHIYNGLVRDEDDLLDSFYPIIDFDLFTSKGERKSLRQLSVNRLTDDVTNWLSRGRVHLQELIVTDHYSINDEDLVEFFDLPSGLSMIWTREKHPWDASPSRYNDSDSDSDEWTDIDSDESSSELSDSDLDHPFYRSTPTQNPSLPRKIATVLDRLPDGGSHLTRLCLALDFEVQWTHFSTRLPLLTRLSHLRINAKSWRGGNYPTLSSSVWPNIIKTSEIARRYALLIVSLCPSLRYLKIGDFAWEVSPLLSAGVEEGNIAERTRSKTKRSEEREVVLRQLDKDEELSIELFSWTDFAEIAGLLAQERDRGEKNDGEEGKWGLEETNALLIERGCSPLPL